MEKIKMAINYYTGYNINYDTGYSMAKSDAMSNNVKCIKKACTEIENRDKYKWDRKSNIKIDLSLKVMENRDKKDPVIRLIYAAIFYATDNTRENENKCWNSNKNTDWDFYINKYFDITKDHRREAARKKYKDIKTEIETEIEQKLIADKNTLYCGMN
jgi:hypothetical protein